jgi:hypothetical protein
MRTIQFGSQEYVSASITATVAGAPYNPTSDLVEFSFPTPGARPTVWYPGSWDPAPNPRTNVYTAICLIGPTGTANPPIGTYQVFIRVTDNPEIPILPAGLLTLT